MKKLLLKIQNNFFKFGSPKMVYGFKLNDGTFVKNIRISNSTFIGNKENLYVENNIFIGHHNFLDASNRLIIEEGCQITNFVSILTHSSHNSIRYYGKNYSGSEMKGYIKGSVFIGKFSFIGPHVTIMPNTKIGKGSIVASHSYVSGEFPDFSIISGNPAKIIGDTRIKDALFFEQNPELKKNYDDWANS